MVTGKGKLSRDLVKIRLRVCIGFFTGASVLHTRHELSNIWLSPQEHFVIVTSVIRPRAVDALRGTVEDSTFDVMSLIRVLCAA